jgi:iron-sulfur cluster repair protein YtfE (RIC family)
VSVLNEHGIDSCCGGAESLAHVAERDGLDLPALLAALESAIEVQVR